MKVAFVVLSAISYALGSADLLVGPEPFLYAQPVVAKPNSAENANCTYGTVCLVLIGSL